VLRKAVILSAVVAPITAYAQGGLNGFDRKEDNLWRLEYSYKDQNGKQFNLRKYVSSREQCEFDVYRMYKGNLKGGIYTKLFLRASCYEVNDLVAEQPG
jgi:hypothetical protein